VGTVYFSVDIEVDGVVAGRNNMLSIGVAAIDMSSGEIVGLIKRNLETVEDLHPDVDTMNWWKRFPEAFVKARENARDPRSVMIDLVRFIQYHASVESVIFAWKPVMDLAFLRYYIHRFHPNGVDLTINSIFGRQGFGLDEKTVAAIALGRRYRNTKMDNLPDAIRKDEDGAVMVKHSHDALEDAVEQAHIFYNLTRKLEEAL
jgi:3' exoribonuclease, RNase T-like